MKKETLGAPVTQMRTPSIQKLQAATRCFTEEFHTPQLTLPVPAAEAEEGALLLLAAASVTLATTTSSHERQSLGGKRAALGYTCLIGLWERKRDPVNSIVWPPESDNAVTLKYRTANNTLSKYTCRDLIFTPLLRALGWASDIRIRLGIESAKFTFLPNCAFSNPLSGRVTPGPDEVRTCWCAWAARIISPTTTMAMARWILTVAMPGQRSQVRVSERQDRDQEDDGVGGGRRRRVTAEESAHDPPHAVQRMAGLRRAQRSRIMLFITI